MALNGAPANLGPESKAWVEQVEKELGDLRRELALALGELRATR